MSARTFLQSAAACAPVLLLTACTPADAPRTRLGSLPFPGPFTLYALADPDALGHHRYDTFDYLFSGLDEAERGTLYTTRAGFLDLAHVRAAADWCRYAYGRIRPALDARRAAVTIPARDLATWRLRLDYPPEWDGASREEREALADEAAIALSCRLAYLIMTWHEIITWYGFNSTIIIPEDASAFTFEDNASHVVGVVIGDRALRRMGTESWDDAVTRALRETLGDLGVVSPRDADAIVSGLEDVWWKDGRCIAPDLDFAVESCVYRPRLAPGAPPARPLELRLPLLSDVLGRDLRSLATIELESAILQMSAIREAAGRAKGPILPMEDFPRILGRINERVAGAPPDS